MVRVPDDPGLMEAALFRDALATRFGHPHPGMTMAQCCRLLAASCTDAPARLRQRGALFAATAWAVSRVGVALFLLAAAGRLGHAGLLSRIIGR